MIASDQDEGPDSLQSSDESSISNEAAVLRKMTDSASSSLPTGTVANTYDLNVFTHENIDQDFNLSTKEVG